MKKLLVGILWGILGVLSIPSFSQGIYDYTVPRWTVTPGDATLAGNLAVTGTSVFTGAVTFNGGTNITGQTFANSILATTASFDAFNTTATTINFGGAATTMAIGAATGTVTIGPAIVGSIATESTTSTTGAWKTAGGLGVAKNLNVGGTLGVTGIATLTAAPVMSALTASQAVFTTAGKALVSNAITGSGNVVMSASPTLTGTIGAASQTLSGTLGVTGLTTLSGGVLGSATNDAATAGNIGELLTVTVASGSAIASSTTVQSNITSLSLTPGDWDVTATCDWTMTGATVSIFSCGLGTTTATQLTQAGGGGVGTDPLAIRTQTNGTTLTGVTQVPLGPVRVSLSGTTTIYLVQLNTFSAGSLAGFGTLRARRMR